MVTEELARDVGVGAEDKSGEDSEAIAEKWKKFKPLMESGELLESYLPWRGVEEKSIKNILTQIEIRDSDKSPWLHQPNTGCMMRCLQNLCQDFRFNWRWQKMPHIAAFCNHFINGGLLF